MNKEEKDSKFIDLEENKIKEEIKKEEKKNIESVEKFNLVNLLALAFYVLLFSAQVLFIKASSDGENGFKYNTTYIVIIIEIVKLIFSFILLYQNTLPVTEANLTRFQQIVNDFKTSSTQSHLFAVPAFFYALYNNLLFFNVVSFGPGIYKVLMNIRIPITGVLTLIFFQRNLTFKQWTSLLALTYGCVLLEISKSPDFQFSFHMSHIFIFFQAFFSSFAGISNEFLFKKISMSLNLQNIWLYLYSIVFNIILLYIMPYFFDSNVENFSIEILIKLFTTYSSLFIIIIWSIAGLTTSFILKYLSTITKAYATSLEMIIVSIFSFLFLGTSLNFWFILSVLIVSMAIILYYNNTDIDFKIILTIFIVVVILFGALFYKVYNSNLTHDKVIHN
jgi:UDP-sugar transporter A1/2/3